MRNCALLLLWFLLTAGFLFCCHKIDAEPDYLTIAKAAPNYSGGAKACLLSVRFFTFVSVILCGV